MSIVPEGNLGYFSLGKARPNSFETQLTDACIQSGHLAH